MWRARLPVPDSLGNVAATADSMGMSFFVLWRHGARFVGHTGSQAGFRSFFYINPVTHAAVIAVYNTSNDVREAESASGFRAVRDSALSLIAH
jgi:CubicO group peptidase (beta-lactamase class C family)